MWMPLGQRLQHKDILCKKNERMTHDMNVAEQDKEQEVFPMAR
jgi:hypothetical protein